MPQGNIGRLIKKAGFPALCFAGIFLIWELGILIFNVPEYLLPAPSKIAGKIIGNFNIFSRHASITMLEAFIGFAIANLLSFVVAVIFVHSKKTEKVFYPLAVALKTIPIIAAAPLLVLWLGIGLASKVMVVILICFFPLLVNTVKGLETASEEQLNLFRSLFASKWQIFIKLRLPNSLPYIFPALKNSAIIAITGAIVGEFVGANEGLGYLILVSTYSFNTVTVFAAVAMSSLTGLVFFGLINLLEKRIVFWQTSD